MQTSIFCGWDSLADAPYKVHLDDKCSDRTIFPEKVVGESSFSLLLDESTDSSVSKHTTGVPQYFCETKITIVLTFLCLVLEVGD